MRAPFSNRVRLHEIRAPAAASDARCSRTTFSASPVSCAISRSSRWPYLRKHSITARASLSRRCSSSAVEGSVSRKAWRRSPITSYFRKRLNATGAAHQDRVDVCLRRSIDDARGHVLNPKERDEECESPRPKTNKVWAGTKSIRGTANISAATALLEERPSNTMGTSAGNSKRNSPDGSAVAMKPATALALRSLGQLLDCILDRLLDRLPVAR